MQSRALGMIRSHILASLRKASAQVQSVITQSGGQAGIVAEGAEISVLYVRFRAAAPDVRGKKKKKSKIKNQKTKIKKQK